MLKKMLMKKMIKSKAGKDVSDTQIDQMMEMVEKNPELFQKIAGEIKEKMNQGKDQMTATMEVMQAHQEELNKLQS